MAWRKAVLQGMAAMALPLAAIAPAHAAEGVLQLIGTGTQVYVCKGADSRFAWVLERPAATLSDGQGTPVLDHGAGPSWTAKDGSKVYGTVTTVIPAPGTGAIPWLVLQASRHEGQGMLSDVASILRTGTQGGVAPATGCDAGHDGAHVEVPYRATYTFVGPHAGP